MEISTTFLLTLNWGRGILVYLRTGFKVAEILQDLTKNVFISRGVFK